MIFFLQKELDIVTLFDMPEPTKDPDPEPNV